jgi:hypothetical protein
MLFQIFTQIADRKDVINNASSTNLFLMRTVERLHQQDQGFMANPAARI